MDVAGTQVRASGLLLGGACVTNMTKCDVRGGRQMEVSSRVGGGESVCTHMAERSVRCPQQLSATACLVDNTQTRCTDMSGFRGGGRGGGRGTPRGGRGGRGE